MKSGSIPFILVLIQACLLSIIHYMMPFVARLCVKLNFFKIKALCLKFQSKGPDSMPLQEYSLIATNNKRAFGNEAKK